MLLYVNCSCDFQEPCIRHQSLTRQQRRSRDLNFETETSSKSPRLENLQDYAEMFLQIFKKLSSPLRSWNFANFRHFSYLFMLFLPADTTDKKYVELKKFHSAILLQYSKSQDNRFEIDPKVQHFRILTFCCKILQLIVAWSWQFEGGWRLNLI